MKRLEAALLSVSSFAILAGGAAAQENAPVEIGAAAAQNGSEDEDVIVVRGLRRSLQMAAEQKQNSDQVIEALVADDIGKFPDNTVAAALQRVPGIQVVNGFNNEIVSPLVRGIGDILTTVDGREIFTGVGRGFSFQDLPAEALAGAQVYKSNSANLIEGGVAGVINLQLHKPFDFKEGWTVAVNARGIYAKEPGKVNGTGGVLISRRWDTEMGEFGALVDVSYSKQRFDRAISFNCDPRSGTNGPPGAAGVVLPTCVGGLNDFGVYNRPQANAALQWRPNDDLEFYVDGLYAGYDADFETDFIFSDIFAAANITNVTATNDCFQARVNGAGFNGGPGDPLQDLCFGSTATFNNVPGLTSTQAKKSNTDQYLIAGGTRYNAGRLHLNLDLSYISSDNRNRNIIVDIGKQIDSVDVIIDDDKHGTTNMPGNPLGDPDDFRFANGFFQEINSAESTMFATKLDGVVDLDWFVDQLQFGFRFGERNAHFRSNAPGGPPAPGGNRVTPVDSVGLPSDFLVLSPSSIPFINGGARWYTPDRDFLLDHTDVIRELYGAPLGDPPDDPSRNFDASEKTYAGYVQARYKFVLGGDMVLDGLVGGRLTKTERTLSGTGRIDGVLTPVTTDTSDTDFLPNFSARLRITPELQARFSAARTISRPFFGDLNPGLFYDIPNNANIQPGGSGGNPDLKPQKSNAFDATLEYYFGPSSYVSVAAYYRTLKDRIAVGSEPEMIDGITYNISRPRNVAGATLKGVEFSAQLFMDFLPEGWDGLGVFGNFTFADSEITSEDDPLRGAPLLGVSKYSYNIGGLYEKYGVTGRIVYTWRDQYNEFQIGGLLRPADQEFAFNKVRANGRLDFSLGYDITENFTISVDGTNVLGANYYSYFDTLAFPHDIRIDDTTYGVSLRARF